MEITPKTIATRILLRMAAACNIKLSYEFCAEIQEATFSPGGNAAAGAGKA
jgi:hypothetical protein